MAKRVLICTVGGSPDPVVHAVVQNRADRVVFLCSTGSGPAASDKTITERTTRKLSVKCPACGKTSGTEERQEPIATRAGLTPEGYEVVSLVDPDDFAAVVRACEGVAVALAARYAGEDVEVVANYTGGTKTMSAALVAFALRQPGWECQANLGARADLVAVRAGDVALPQDVSTLRLGDVLTLARDLHERGDFVGASDVTTNALTRMKLTPREREPLLTLRAEAERMAAWDAFDHALALRLTEAMGADREGDVKRLRVILRIRELLTGTKPWGPKDVAGTELVDDLLDNARRCERRGRYDDAVGRLYRATELLAQVRLRRAHDQRSGDVDLTRTPEVSRPMLEAHRDHVGRIKIGLDASYKLLRDLGDPLGAWYALPANLATLRELLSARNDSLFAHGLEPVDAAVWQRVGGPWFAWLRGAMDALRAAS